MISQEIEKYIQNHTTPEDPLLAELNRETHLKVMHPRMLSGHLQGVFLYIISQMIHPKQILEIGTYTGYSALCLLRGLAPNGLLHTIELNEELIDFAAKYFKRVEGGMRIKQYAGEALKIIPGIHEQFDLVFIDADKENYLNYYQLVFDKVRQGGYILADNTLWDGKVIAPKKLDKETRGIVEFNEAVQNDKRVTNLLLPIRDGIMIMKKL